MIKSLNTKSLKKFGLPFLVLLISIILTYINWQLKLEATPAWHSGILGWNHKLLMDFDYTNNEQSRLFQFLIPEMFIKLFDLNTTHAYTLQRILFTGLTFFLFFFYCRKWLNKTLSFLCILVFALMIMPATYQNALQESAPLMSLTFLCALWFIRDGKDYLFMMVLLVGSINNETSLFLPAIYIFYHYESKTTFLKVLKRTVLLSLPAFTAVGIIRYINIDRPHLGGAWHLPENIEHIDTLFMSYHIFWILPFLYFTTKPNFLKRSLLTLPFFIIPHLLTGQIWETRQMLPIGFILLPASFLTLQKLKDRINDINSTLYKDQSN